jgi:DNA gyrase inhibitor GyrI
MIQREYCSCGESTILGGRCTGCNKFRPTADEIRITIGGLYDEINKLSNQLMKIERCEIQDGFKDNNLHRIE